MYRQCRYTREHNRGVAKRTIHLTDDLEQRVRDAQANGGINVSGASQLAIGYVLNHGDRALSEALNGTSGVDGHQDQAQAELVQLAGRLEQAVRQQGQESQRVTARLASLEQQVYVLVLGFLALLVISAMTLVSARSLRTA